MNFSEYIRIIQWNCCSIREKLPQLQAISHSFDIICVQESLLWEQPVLAKRILCCQERYTSPKRTRNLHPGEQKYLL